MKRQHWTLTSSLVLAATLAGGGAAAGSSLDGAGRIVILPLAVSGLERESTIYLTNPSSRALEIFSMYVGADGTPFAASVSGTVACISVPVRPDETRVLSLSQLCPRLSTPDIENLGYVQFAVSGGFDAAPFLVTSVVNTRNGNQFGVEGVPTGAFDPGRNAGARRDTLRVAGLDGEVVVSGVPVLTKVANCYLATLGEKKTVTVRLMEYASGQAVALGNPIPITLDAFTMVKLSNVLGRAGVAASTNNFTTEFYAETMGPPGANLPDNGAALIAACGIEFPATGTEEFRLARTPSPRDGSRSRAPVVGDTKFRVGPFQVGYWMAAGQKASMSFYLRHEDRARCWLVPSVLRPSEDPVPWQELRVFDPDGRWVAGGDNQSDTGIFFTGPKNAIAVGENRRWTVEVSWREYPSGHYPPPGVTLNIFGVRCESTSGVSALLPLALGADNF